MLANNDGAFDALISKLKRLGRLDKADIAAIASLPSKIETGRSGQYIVKEGLQVEACCVLLDGYACRNKLTQEGRRQIVSFHMAGDILDLQHFLLQRSDHNVQLITAATYVWIPVEALLAVVRSHPNVAEALWRDSLIDASIFREWVLNVGQRDSKTRIAHMLCEFAVRRAAAGLGSPDNFELPMTQEQIADATGMTAIHVNRMLGELREQGVIRRDKRTVEIVDWEEMRHIADFDPAYLHQAA